MERLAREMILNKFVDSENFSLYLRELLINQLNLKKHKKLTISSCELFLLRILCEMLQNPEERKELHPDVISTIEEYFPGSMEFCNIILYYYE